MSLQNTSTPWSPAGRSTNTNPLHTLHEQMRTNVTQMNTRSPMCRWPCPLVYRRVCNYGHLLHAANPEQFYRMENQLVRHHQQIKVVSYTILSVQDTCWPVTHWRHHTPVRRPADFLGVTFDKRLTWKQHIQNAEAKARRKHITRKLAGTQWSASDKILKNVYHVLIPYGHIFCISPVHGW
jgi:hypothetical protein